MIIDGKKIAADLQAHLKKEIEQIEGRKPSLAFLLVGTDPASMAYVRMKKKRCKEVGITSIDLELSASTSQDTLVQEIEKLNRSGEIDGILVQLPLPSHIDTYQVLSTIDPKKDVDGFHPMNMGKLLLGEKSGFFPCTPYGVMTLLNRSDVKTEGKHVVIVGRSNIVGKPLAALLVQKNASANATVTVAHSASENLPDLCRSADIVIAAVGRPKTITKEMIKEGAVVVDVGISRTDEGLVGDVDFEEVAPRCSQITPVPGGVGPMTIAMLLSNTLLSYQRAHR